MSVCPTPVLGDGHLYVMSRSMSGTKLPPFMLFAAGVDKDGDGKISREETPQQFLEQGMFGGIVSLGLLLALWSGGRYLIGESTKSIVWSFLFSTFLPPEKAATLLAAGILAGLLGSWMSLRETTEDAPVRG